MSTLRVDNIQGQTADGKNRYVVQVVQENTNTQTTTTSTSYSDTGLTASITPQLSTNKVLVVVNQRLFRAPNASCTVNLYRDNADVSPGVAISRYGLTDETSTGDGNFLMFTFLDSPSTTSSVTYKTVFKRTSGSGVIYAQLDSNISTITLTEIAQ